VKFEEASICRAEYYLKVSRIKLSRQAPLHRRYFMQLYDYDGCGKGIMGTAKKRIIIIGLDGGTFDLINPLIAEGRLPNLAKLINEGASGELCSTMPPVTAPAWITFLTGKSPGNHGAYNFRTFDLTKYSSFREEIINTNWFAGDTIFEILSRRNMRVGALGVPMTYPPFEVNGFIVASGAPRTIIDEKSVYPPELLSKVGRFDMPLKYGKENRDYFLRYMEEHLERHTKITEMMLKEDDYDLFMVVFGNTDWASHQYWEYTDPSFPTYDEEQARKYRNVIADQYMAADRSIGKIMSFMDSDTIIMIMSDHGSGVHPVRNFNVNSWLRDKGLLKARRGSSMVVTDHLYKLTNLIKNKVARYHPVMRFLRRVLPDGLRENISSIQLNTRNIVWEETKAYWVPFIPMFDSIVINRKGRQPQGTVADEEEYNSLREYIKRELLKVTDPENGRPVVDRVFMKEEIFTGSYIDNAPDLVIMFHETYTGSGRFSADLIEPVDNIFLSTNSGFHRLNGIFIAYGSDIRKGEKIKNANIIDLPSTILYALDADIPLHMEGRILKEIFRPEFLEKNRERYVRTKDKASPEGEDAGPLSEQEEEQMRKTLKGLGYM